MGELIPYKTFRLTALNLKCNEILEYCQVARARAQAARERARARAQAARERAKHTRRFAGHSASQKLTRTRRHTSEVTADGEA
jgi:hypothetical protein